MSSLKATQADGFYRPPSYFDSGSYKKKSLSQFVGSKGHNQFLTKSIVRFEMPYDGFCLTCQAVASKGTRFNAHKSHADNYHTSKIYEFTMKCCTCKQEFRIRNDPQRSMFVYVSGIKRKIEEFDTIEAESHGIIDTDNGNMIIQNGAGNVQSTILDPLSKLETRMAGERKALSDRDSLEFLLKHNAVTMFDDGACNSKLRSVYRVDRKARKRRFEAASALGLGESFELQDHLSEDVDKAKAVLKQKPRSSSTDEEKLRFRKIRTESIFPGLSKNKADHRNGKGRQKPNSSEDRFMLQMNHINVDVEEPKKTDSMICTSLSLQMLSGYGSDSSANT
jgi:hypothetical protein